MNNRIYEAIEDEMLMEDFTKGSEILTTDSIYDSYEHINSYLYCDECNIWENEKYEILNGGN